MVRRPIHSLMNRLKDLLDPTPREPSGDYWVVRGECGFYQVTRETAREIEDALDRLDAPTWVSFIDCVGSRVRVRSAHINAVYECTSAQRTAQRALNRVLEQEERAGEHPWEGEQP